MKLLKYFLRNCKKIILARQGNNNKNSYKGHEIGEKGRHDYYINEFKIMKIINDKYYNHNYSDYYLPTSLCIAQNAIIL